MVVVADASAIVEYLLGSDPGLEAASIIEAEDTSLHVPALCDVEVASAFRGLALAQEVDVSRLLEAMVDYADLPLTRHGHVLALERIFALRHNFSAYDATYLALAESLAASLLTCDGPFARAAGRQLPELNVLHFGEHA